MDKELQMSQVCLGLGIFENHCIFPIVSCPLDEIDGQDWFESVPVKP